LKTKQSIIKINKINKIIKKLRNKATHLRKLIIKLNAMSSENLPTKFYVLCVALYKVRCDQRL